ncbi:MAG: hypothetical protein ACK4I8_11265 [Armatimonadota bacterium]
MAAQQHRCQRTCVRLRMVKGMDEAFNIIVADRFVQIRTVRSALPSRRSWRNDAGKTLST